MARNDDDQAKGPGKPPRTAPTPKAPRTGKDGVIRYAVVGLGNIAQVAILPSFQNAKNARVTALVSSDRKKLDELGKRYGVSALGSYDEMEQVLDRGECDAVYIALPNTMHRQFTERAARAGRHVLCEKPMAMSEDDCEAMISACQEAGVKLMVAYRLHFEEGNLSAIASIQSGEIGEARSFSAVFSQQVRPGDIRTREASGGGALFDMGVYCLNAARYLFRDEPLEVFAYSKSDDPRFEGVDDTTTVIMRFGDERLAQFTCSQAMASSGAYRVVGEKGELRMEPAFDYAVPLKQYVTVDGKTTERTFEKRDQFGPELIYFADCILGNKEPEPSGIEGLADVRVMRAIQQSARVGRPVPLSPFERRQYAEPSQLITCPAVIEPDTVNAPGPTEG